MKIKIISFGKIEDEKLFLTLQNDLSRIHPKYIFIFDKAIIPTDKSFRIGFYRKVPLFDARKILDHVKDETKTTFVITKFPLPKEQKLQSALLGGLCRRKDKVLIISYYNLSEYNTILTLANHELGHLFGLPHCQDEKCIMVEGYNGASITNSTYWCSTCSKIF